MIFKVVAGVPLRESNSNIDCVPAFKDADDTVLRYIFLYYDYDSPFFRQSKELREEQVCVACGFLDKAEIIAFKNKNASSLAKVKEAFLPLQYNVEFEALESCKAQVEEWNELLIKKEKSDKEMDLAFKVFDKMTIFLERIKKMEEIVGYREKYDKKMEDDVTALELVMRADGSK